MHWSKIVEEKTHKLGIFVWFGYRLHIGYRARIIKDAGFDVVSLWWGDEEKANTGSLYDLPSIVRDRGLSIDNIHVPFDDCNDFWSEAESDRQNIIDRYCAWLDDCARHKIPKMVMHLTQGPNPPSPNKSGLAVIKKLVQEAEDKNVILAVENIQCIEHLEFVFSRIDSPHLAFCYDSSHDFLWSRQPCELLNKWAGRLVTTHFSDNDGQDDRHWLPNTGTIDWQKIGRSFPIETYSGPFLLELLPEQEVPKRPAEEFATAAYESACMIAEILLQARQQGPSIH
jgi:sugar phosphate isomerase/epimerase